MKNLLFTGWTMVRWMYLLLGAMVMIQSYQESRWWGFSLGVLLAAMGILRLGCAAGACAVPEANEKTVQDAGDIDYEEVK